VHIPTERSLLLHTFEVYSQARQQVFSGLEDTYSSVITLGDLTLETERRVLHVPRQECTALA
jgi:hypothetical protein